MRRRRQQPLTLRLPFAIADRHWKVEQVLAADETRTWASCLPLLSRFALSGPELCFARRLLATKRNLWLFRCNQGGFCGDFIAIDMSSSIPAQRSVAVMELKSGAAIRHGGGGAGNQLHRSQEAIRELINITRLINRHSPVQLLTGDGDNVIAWLNRRAVQHEVHHA